MSEISSPALEKITSDQTPESVCRYLGFSTTDYSGVLQDSIGFERNGLEDNSFLSGTLDIGTEKIGVIRIPSFNQKR
jgi:hypothetical protein